MTPFVYGFITGFFAVVFLTALFIVYSIFSERKHYVPDDNGPELSSPQEDEVDAESDGYNDPRAFRQGEDESISGRAMVGVQPPDGKKVRPTGIDKTLPRQNRDEQRSREEMQRERIDKIRRKWKDTDWVRDKSSEPRLESPEFNGR